MSLQAFLQLAGSKLLILISAKSMVEVLAISFRCGNSTFAQSGWFMHAWSHAIALAIRDMHVANN